MNCFNVLDSMLINESPDLAKRLRGLLSGAGTTYNQIVSHIQDKGVASGLLQTAREKYNNDIKEATSLSSKDLYTHTLCVHNAIFKGYHNVLEFFFNYNEHGLLVRVIPKSGDPFKLKKEVYGLKAKSKVTLLSYTYHQNNHGHPMNAQIMTADNRVIHCSMTDLRPNYRKEKR